MTAQPRPKGQTALQRIDGARWHFDGEVGARLERNSAEWIRRAPGANPGIIDMFHRRNRHIPYPELVPWAGEFAGKFLVSAVQACRLSDDPALRRQVASFAAQLVACQAPNGYLGPFPKDRELLGACDLWGHYHCMLGLLMWHDDQHDAKAYQAVVRAAELICRTYLDGTRRPIESGSPNFNLAVIHIMAELHRRTGSARYRAMCERIIDDLPKDGDWLEGGSNGTPYFRLPGSGPRWEALHILQGFASLYEATGDEKYKRALLSHYRSIRDLDRHPSGAFSTNEGASGTIFASGSIETCCSVAWMALCIDALRLTGDSTVADEIELTFWNQALAAQHPSGSWCTYDTPLNGIRAPSYHQINFQYRPGAPELNCCSVNSPRTLGMLPEWAVMRSGSGVAVNFYGPSDITIPLRAQARVRITQQTSYPVDGTVRMVIEPLGVSRFALRLRIPGWAEGTKLMVNGAARPTPKAGAYAEISRIWKPGDVIELRFGLGARVTLGQGPDRGGRIALHRGPLLLAVDAQYNDREVGQIEPIDARSVTLHRTVSSAKRDGVHYPPMGLWTVKPDGGRPIVLCDFASAGSNGTEYAAWVRASHIPPGAARLALPEADQVGRPSPVLFRWTPSGSPDDTYTLVVARDAAFAAVVVRIEGLKTPHATVSEKLIAEGDYYWKVLTSSPDAVVENTAGPRRFRVAQSHPGPFLSVRSDGAMVVDRLHGIAHPDAGALERSEGLTSAPGRDGGPNGSLLFGSPTSGLVYRLPYFPETDYSFVGWVCPSGLPVQGIRQVFSAWCRGGDDPLRVTVEGAEVSARIEGGGMWRTPGARLENGAWAHVAAVKRGRTLTLYLNGRPAGSTEVPDRLRSLSTQVGIGFNPLYSGGERYSGRIADAAFYERALSAEEVAASAG